MALAIATLLAALPAPVTLNGVAGVRLGMTPSQVQHAWGLPIALGAPKPGSTCQMTRISTGSVRGYALFYKHRFNAVLFTAGVKTDRGIGVGSTRMDIERAYGSKVFYFPGPSPTRFHVYTRARYLGDGTALRFDLDDRSNRVTQIGFGGRLLHTTSGRC